MMQEKSSMVSKRTVWIWPGLESFIAGLLIGITKYARKSLSRRQREKVMPDPLQFGLNYSPVSFPSRDSLMLQGWWFKTSLDKPVIMLLHGVGANRSEPPERVFGLAKELISHGYNVLTFDFRAHGESEGDYISAGYYEKNDLLGAIDFIKKQGIKGKIGVLGFSMGAAISLIAAAESNDIAAVVADSSYIDMVSIVKWKFSKWGHLFPFLVPLFLFVIRTFFSIDFNRVRPVDAIKLIKVPVFIIHGGKDNTIPVEHAYRLRSACRNRYNQLWVVPEANHTDAFTLRTKEYLSRVLSFFSKAFASMG